MTIPTTPTTDPIVAEVRAARDQHAAKFGYDLKAIFRDIQTRQESSGRKYVRYASLPVTTARNHSHPGCMTV